MSSLRDRIGSWTVPLALAASPILVAEFAQAQTATTATHPGVGRPATAKEIEAWDIDVRPDFKGLPPGSGSVAKGMEVWESKCSSCHGIFGESNEVFSPIVGGTTKGDVETGRVARLNDPSFPGRTTLMKVSSVSTLWDYINRAMPWTQPKSLSIEEVYGVTAYILNLGEVLPDNFVLSDKNIAEVQKLLPNRNGMTTDHALWPGAGMGKRAPDVKAAACMRDCGPVPTLASFLPEFARNAHGNLSQQNRAVGAQRGADTSKPAPAAGAQSTAPKPSAAPAPKLDAGSGAAAAIALTQKHGCVACHGMDSKLIGPSLRDIAKKYAGQADGAGYLAGKIEGGGAGVWGGVAMPPQKLGEADARAIAQWLADGAKK
jgi:S-disulfanyl-L-cysteine oxidoreductase SoxD